jgi:hypothetical protein
LLAKWEPPVDVFEDEGEIVIVVAMPGVAAERVQVTQESGTLVVRTPGSWFARTGMLEPAGNLLRRP